MLGIGDLSPDLMWGGGEDELIGGPYTDVINRFATLESGGGRLRSNPDSNARGLLHFLPDTWRGVLRNYPDLGFTESDIDNDDKQRIAAERLLEREIVPALRRTLGRDPTPAELYTAWGLGAPDAQKLFAADPNAPAAGLFRPAVASSNRSIFYRDKAATEPRTAAEVAAEYARRFNGAKPMPETPMTQPEYDVDRGVANIAAMGERVGQMQPGAGVSALQPRPQAQGLSALSPYRELAAQLMPSRSTQPWADALINAGAAMMQSTRPDFLGGLGAGLQAGNQALVQGRNIERQDNLDRFNLSMKLAQFDQKDGGEFAMSDGVLYNKRTGQTQQVAGDKPLSDAGKLQSDLRAGRITPEQYEAAMSKIRGEGESPVMRAMREAGIDPTSPEGQKLIKDYAARVGGGATVNIDNKAETEFAKKLAASQAETYTSVMKAAASAPGDNARLDRLGQLLDGVQTGKYSTSLMELQKGLSTILGKNAPTIFGKPAEVAQAEAAQALSNEIALTLRNPAGGAGMPGALSDGDRQFLSSMVPGLETTAEGRKVMIETQRRLNGRKVEEARLMRDYIKANGGKLDGWEIYVAEWAQKNPLFGDLAIPDAAIPNGVSPSAPNTSGPPAARGLPPSDAELRKTQPGAPPSGGIIPSPKRFDLGTAPKVGAQPPAGDIPTFSDPNDPAYLRLPPGSVWRAPDGSLRIKQ